MHVQNTDSSWNLQQHLLEEIREKTCEQPVEGKLFREVKWTLGLEKKIEKIGVDKSLCSGTEKQICVDKADVTEILFSVTILSGTIRFLGVDGCLQVVTEDLQHFISADSKVPSNLEGLNPYMGRFHQNAELTVALQSSAHLLPTILIVFCWFFTRQNCLI